MKLVSKGNKVQQVLQGKTVLLALRVRGVKMEMMVIMEIQVIQVQRVLLEKMVREVNMEKEPLH